MNEFCVYKHTCPNGKVYIGITCNNPLVRWRHGEGYRGNKHFYRAILKYGWDNIKHEILCEGLSKDGACQKEIELIAEYKSNNPEFGYNQASGGDVNIGWHHTEETKAKMRKSKSEQARQHMSEVAKKRGQPKQWNRKGKAPWNKGKKHDYAPGGCFTRRKVINLDTGEIFESVTEAATKCNAPKVILVCKGIRHKSGGYRFAYLKGGDAE